MYRQDASNYETAKKTLGHATLLPDDVLQLYTLHHETVKRFLKPGVAEMAGCLYMLCSTHLILGTLALLRLHVSQACRETRAAVECAGIAFVIQEDPAKYQIFLNDKGDNEEARRLAKRTFKTDIIFPKNEPLVHELRTYYEAASQLSHTNTMTLVPHLSGSKKGRPLVVFTYQDIHAETNDKTLPTMLLWICMAHLDILFAADVAFNGIPKDQVEGLNRQRQLVFERVIRFQQTLTRG